MDFVANGHDFWFAKDEGVSLAECAAITLLDYFNCKLGDTPFRALCDADVIEADGTAWISGYLQERRGGSAVTPFDKSVLFPEPEERDDLCCPFHEGPRFDATRNEEIVGLYTRAQTFAKAHITPAPILMLGEEVMLDPDKFVVQGNLIHVLGKEALTPVNFAACWNSGGFPENYIEVGADVGVVHLLVPPIVFTESATGYHLQFDFFRNSWMVKHRQATVPVPTINDQDPELVEDDPQSPWLDAVDPALVAGGRRERTADLWWAA